MNAVVTKYVAPHLKEVDQRLEGIRPSVLICGTVVLVFVGQKLVAAVRAGPTELFEAAKRSLFSFLRRHFGKLLGYEKALKEVKMSFLKEFSEKQTLSITHDVLPSTGMDYGKVLKLCKDHADLNCDFTKGQYSGSVYHGGMDGYTEFINQAMDMHQWTNPLHAGQFGGIRKMEAETISMVRKMFHGDEEACGALTSGGTESIIMAIRAYKNFAAATRGITKPELVVPVTAHAAFDKACEYFNIKLHHARMDPVTCKVDLRHMRSLINSNTIGLVGSAPHFPHGIVDPIEEISEMGRKRGIPVHVDACLGGFIIAFMEKAGLEVGEKFDFRLPGVMSISCDTHKYGFAPKGSSTILYRSQQLRTHQMFSQPNWPGGIYASPTISGSRVGNVVAGTWAALMHHGEKGYVESTKRIVKAARYIAEECSKMPGLKVMGDPKLTVVALKSDEFDIYRLMSFMADREWELNSLQFPPSIHIAVTNLHAVNDLENARRLVNDLRAGARVLMETKHDKATGSAAMYGTTQSIPDRSIIGDAAKAYFDAYYETHVKEEYEALAKELAKA